MIISAATSDYCQEIALLRPAQGNWSLEVVRDIACADDKKSQGKPTAGHYEKVVQYRHKYLRHKVPLLSIR